MKERYSCPNSLTLWSTGYSDFVNEKPSNTFQTVEDQITQVILKEYIWVRPVTHTDFCLVCGWQSTPPMTTRRRNELKDSSLPVLDGPRTVVVQGSLRPGPPWSPCTNSSLPFVFVTRGGPRTEPRFLCLLSFALMRPNHMTGEDLTCN